MTILPRNVICVIGNWHDFSLVKTTVAKYGQGFSLDAQYSQLVPDKRMEEAFRASLDLNNPTIDGDQWRMISEHRAVAYILSPPIKKAEAEKIAATALLLTAELLAQGGVAAKSESAGLAHGRQRWLDLAKQYQHAIETGDEHTAAATLYYAWVQRAIYDEQSGSLYSVGMHLLGQRDTEVDDDIEVDLAVRWIDLMGLYLVADKPSRSLADGQGFRLSDTGPRRIIELDECWRYEEDDFFYNPYGYIRLVAEPD
jgi:hypothetical protein